MTWAIVTATRQSTTADGMLPANQTGLPRDSKAQAEQVRSVSVDRVGGLLGQLPVALIAELDRALRVQLSL